MLRITTFCIAQQDPRDSATRADIHNAMMYEEQIDMIYSVRDATSAELYINDCLHAVSYCYTLTIEQRMYSDSKSPGTRIQAAQFSSCFQSAKVADAGPVFVAPRGIVCEKTSTERKLCVTVHVPK